MDKKKLFAVITLLGGCGAVYLNCVSSASVATVVEAQSSAHKNKLVEPKSAPQEPEGAEVIQTQIAQLQQQIKEINRQALLKGGLAAPKTFDYDDDWCIASQDLSKQDQIIEYNQRQAFYKEHARGERVIVGHRVVDENMVNYLSMDSDTLMSLAQSDDLVALRVIAEKSHDAVTTEMAYQAAERLVILGDWKTGISILVIRGLYDAKYIAKKKPDQAKAMVVKALAYAELGLQRGTGITAVFVVLSDNQEIKQLVYSADEHEVLAQVEKLTASINHKRLAESLAPLNEEVVPKEALSGLRSTIARLYDRGGREQFLALLKDKALFPSHWYTQYLDTPCIQRIIANRKAYFHQIPAIQQKIAQLQNQLH